MLIQLAQEVDEKSGAFQAGKILGYIVIVVLLILLVRWLMNRNK